MVEFNGMELIKENVKVTWDYIGEGASGDYDEADENDVALLRFEVYRKDEGSHEWEYVENSSYCTNFPVDISNATKRKGLETIMNLVFDKVQNGESIKKMCEKISHIDETFNIPYLT